MRLLAGDECGDARLQAPFFYDDPQGHEIDGFVTVTEYHEGELPSNYRYWVVHRVIEAHRDGNAGFISGQGLIEEVTPL